MNEESKIQIPDAEAAQFVSVPVADYVGYITMCRDMELLKAAEAWYGGLDPEKLLKLMNWCEEQKAKGNG